MILILFVLFSGWPVWNSQNLSVSIGVSIDIDVIVKPFLSFGINVIILIQFVQIYLFSYQCSWKEIWEELASQNTSKISIVKSKVLRLSFNNILKHWAILLPVFHLYPLALILNSKFWMVEVFFPYCNVECIVVGFSGDSEILEISIDILVSTSNWEWPELFNFKRRRPSKLLIWNWLNPDTPLKKTIRPFE